MNREIKFRGKSIDNNEWLYGHLTFWAGRYQIWVTEKDGDTHNYLIDGKTVGQFTGLLDKNGVEIYEGDIVKGRTENTFMNWVVSYCEDFCEFGLYRKNYEHHCRFIDINRRSSEIEVIGNIYEDSHLIKEVE